MKNQFITRKNYSSDSVDITLKCRNYLQENNFYENQEIENLKLIEKSLVNYSILKMADWGIDFDKVGIEDWDNLGNILEVLNRYIPTKEEKEGFFDQYTYCIIYFYSVIRHQEPIKWIKSNDTIVDYTYITDNGELKKFITRKSTQPYKTPLSLLNKLKSYSTKEKNPVLKK